MKNIQRKIISILLLQTHLLLIGLNKKNNNTTINRLIIKNQIKIAIAEIIIIIRNDIILKMSNFMEGKFLHRID